VTALDTQGVSLQTSDGLKTFAWGSPLTVRVHGQAGTLAQISVGTQVRIYVQSVQVRRRWLSIS